MISIDGLLSLTELLKSLDIEMHQRVALSVGTEALAAMLKGNAKRRDASQQGREIHDSIRHYISGDRGIVGSTSVAAANLECGTSGEAPQQSLTSIAQTEADSIAETIANALGHGFRS